MSAEKGQEWMPGRLGERVSTGAWVAGVPNLGFTRRRADRATAHPPAHIPPISPLSFLRALPPPPAFTVPRPLCQVVRPDATLAREQEEATPTHPDIH